jgi:hypothetical protein
MKVILDERLTSIGSLTMEFLRRVVNELNGRRFEYMEEPINEGEGRDFVSVSIKAEDLLKVLPDVAREFAGAIRPEFTRCHKLSPLPAPFNNHYTARDPISGVSIRCFRHWHVMIGDIVYRFDAAFS